MIELLTGLLIGGTVAALAVGYVAHQREERRPPTPPPPPPRVQVWMDNRLIYDGPERRESPRLHIDSDQSYRWPDLQEEATPDPDPDKGVNIDLFEARRRMAAEREVKDA